MTDTPANFMTVKYKCTNCRYEFTAKTDRSVIACPYCNKKTIKLIETGPNFVDGLLKDM